MQYTKFGQDLSSIIRRMAKDGGRRAITISRPSEWGVTYDVERQTANQHHRPLIEVVWDTLQYSQGWKDYNHSFKNFKIYNIFPKKHL